MINQLKTIPKPGLAFMAAVAFGFLIGFCTRGAVGPSLAGVLSGTRVAEFPDGTSLWFYQRRPAHAAVMSSHEDFGVRATVATDRAGIHIVWRSRELPPEPIYFPRNRGGAR